jgi:tetratricopeptide (TPR) repeat protein
VPLSGALSDVPFPALLHHLHGLRASGVLHLQNRKRKKALQVRDGYATAVRSNLLNECFGNFLVRTGRITAHDLSESIRRLKSGEGMQGQILVAMQVLAEDEIASVLVAQAEEKLFEIFEWQEGHFEFRIGARLEGGTGLPPERSPANLILQGVRKRFPIGRVDSFLAANAGCFAAQGESPFYRFQEIDLEPEEAELLRGLDGTKRLSELMRSPEPLRRTLYALIVTDLLELRGGASDAKAPGEQAPTAQPREQGPVGAVDGSMARPVGAVAASMARPVARVEAPTAPPVARVEAATAPPVAAVEAQPARPADPAEEQLRADLTAMAERLRGRSYFEILGVNERASDEDIRSAYVLMAKRTHPDRFSGASDPVKRVAGEIFGLVSTAYEHIGDAKRRLDYLLQRREGERNAADLDEGQRALQAELQFQQGEAKLRARQYEEAVECFRWAVKLYPEEGEYHAHLGWAEYLVDPNDDAVCARALLHIKKGVKLAPDRDKAFLFLGRIQQARGRSDVARKMFTRAVENKPDCIEALRELRLLHMRQEKERDKGLIGRILRR